MKRIRNVAVRMRPPAPADASTDDTGIDLAGGNRVLRPGPPDASAMADPPDFRDPPVRRRRQIWDLESDTDEADDGPLQLQNPEFDEPSPEIPHPDLDLSPPPQPASAGRTKTRVLGFHSKELETDAFSAAAAAPTPDPRFPAGWLVVIDGPGRGAHFAVTTSVSTIGRGADQAIALDFGDMNISRSNHAAIAYDSEQNRFFLGHGNKSNVVRHNGQPVLATEEIFDGDQIRIGKTSLRFVALCGPEFTWDDDLGAETGGGHA